MRVRTVASKDRELSADLGGRALEARGLPRHVAVDVPEAGHALVENDLAKVFEETALWGEHVEELP